MNIVWCAKNLNHYKIDLLNELGALPDVTLHVNYLREGKLDSRQKFKRKHFKSQLALIVSLVLKSKGAWVMIPLEKKWVLTLLASKILGLNIFTYTHGHIHREGKPGKLNGILSSSLIKLYDVVVFYTQGAMEKFVPKYGLKNRFSYANNTLNFDINKIDSNLISKTNGILFVGRINPRKKIDRLIHAVNNLNEEMEVSLHIIGPLEGNIDVVKEESYNIHYHGPIYDDEKIRKIAAQCKIFCIPGRSGLSIVHALSLGLPFVTTQNDGHGPEIGYVCNNENGWILPAEYFEEGLKSILLKPDEDFLVIRQNIIDSCQNLTLKIWAERIYEVLSNES